MRVQAFQCDRPNCFEIGRYDRGQKAPKGWITVGVEGISAVFHSRECAVTYLKSDQAPGTIAE